MAKELEISLINKYFASTEINKNTKLPPIYSIQEGPRLTLRHIALAYPGLNSRLNWETLEFKMNKQRIFMHKKTDKECSLQETINGRLSKSTCVVTNTNEVVLSFETSSTCLQYHKQAMKILLYEHYRVGILSFSSIQ